MKKPLILLVDDEPAVLEALEAALAPAFEEICRIEPFDDPRQVLEATAGWAEERRPIALAIVDQKMPHLSGVDLLKRLREWGIRAPDGGAQPAAFHPAAHMRAILLTGYAGLDSALAAKNEAGVDRYVEKPWDGAALLASARALFASHGRAAESDVHFVFREVATAGEARRHMELRLQVYRTTAYRNLLPETEVLLEVDNYDPVSRLLGLWMASADGGAMIGTLRVTGQDREKAADLIEVILEPFPSLRERVHQAREHPLPMMKYIVERDAVADLVATLEGRGERVVEPGRLTLLPAWRAGSSVGLRHLARHIVESAVSFFFCFRIENAILTCSPPHDSLYTPLGFRDVPGTARKVYPEFGKVVICMHASCSGVPSPVRERVEVMAERIRLKGFTCHCPTFPECLPGPYATGEFRGTDLFCPLRAKEILGQQGARAETSTAPEEAAGQGS